MKRIARLLKEEDNFFIASHVNPDLDALGSAIALALGLKSIGKKTFVFDIDGVPEHNTFLPKHEMVTTSINCPDMEHMTLIILDCNKPQRAGVDCDAFKNSVVIDHHETESDFGDYRWIEPKTPATGLMIYELLNEMGITITEDIAINLYAAIALDTGTFRFSNATPKAFRAAAALVEAGAKPGWIADNMYQNWTPNRFDLFVQYLQSFETEGSIGIAVASREMFAQSGTTPADTENFANYPLILKDIEIGVFLRQVDTDHWKISLRSKGNFNVANIAVQFDGGGHRNAAGCSIKADLATTKHRLIEAIRKSS